MTNELRTLMAVLAVTVLLSVPPAAHGGGPGPGPGGCQNNWAPHDNGQVVDYGDPLVFGAPATGILTNDERSDWYTFPVEPGNTYYFRITGDDLINCNNIQIVVYPYEQAEGQVAQSGQITKTSTWSCNTNPCNTLQLNSNETDVWTIAVHNPYCNNASFEYELWVECSGNDFEDCDNNGQPDFFTCSDDCNANGTIDFCDISNETSTDCNDNGTPDECEFFDCNGNGIVDSCDVDLGDSDDCNDNDVPDECELDCDLDGVIDDCEGEERVIYFTEASEVTKINDNGYVFFGRDGDTPTERYVTDLDGNEWTIALSGDAVDPYTIDEFPSRADMNNSNQLVFKAELNESNPGTNENGAILYADLGPSPFAGDNAVLSTLVQSGDILDGQVVCDVVPFCSINEAGQIGFAVEYLREDSFNCDEDDNKAIFRYTPGVGIEKLGDRDLIVGFPSTEFGGPNAANLNQHGHAVTVADDIFGITNFGAIALMKDPGVYDLIAIVGGDGPDGTTFFQLSDGGQKTCLNDNDQVLYRANLGEEGVESTGDHDDANVLILWTPGVGNSRIVAYGDPIGDNFMMESPAEHAVLNNQGHAAYIADLLGDEDFTATCDEGGPNQSLLFWDGVQNHVVATQGDDANGYVFTSFAAALALNDSDALFFQAEYISPDDSSCGFPFGMFCWTPTGGIQPVIREGDFFGDNEVTKTDIVSPSNFKRFLSESGLTAVVVDSDDLALAPTATAFAFGGGEANRLVVVPCPSCDVVGTGDCNDNGIPDGLEVLPEPAAAIVNGQADDCENARHICPGPVYTANNLTATNDGGLLECDGALGLYDVWYRYRPKWSGPVLVSYAGSSIPTFVSVHSGCPGGPRNLIACGSPPQMEAKFLADRKEDYWFRVTGIGVAQGEFQIQVIGPDCSFSAADCNDNGIPDDCDCIADVNGDGAVEFGDLFLIQLKSGQSCNGCPEDLDGNGEVNVEDEVIFWNNFGPCPERLRGGDGKKKPV